MRKSLLLLWQIRKKLKKRLRSGRSIWVHEINRKRERLGEFHHLFADLKNNSNRFHQYFRMSFAQFSQLAEKVGPYIVKKDTNFRKAISCEERLAITLRFLATGDSQRTIANSYRCGYSTVCGIIQETCEAIWTALLQPEFLSTPSSPEQWKRVAKDFYELWNFPNCCGAIDGKHKLHTTPVRSSSNFFSIVLLGICDANYCFLYIDVGSFGRQNDAGIFSSSDIGIRG